MSNQDTITAFLAQKGLLSAQIAGVEGNLKIESNFSPTANNPREGAIGIAQWEGGRRTALQNYARSVGGVETDLNVQLGFLWQELNTTEKGAMSALLASTTPAAAATAFDQKYERSSAASLPARVAAAQAIAAGGLQGGSGQVQTGGSSGGTSATATPANAVTDAAGGFLGTIGKLVGGTLAGTAEGAAQALGIKSLARVLLGVGMVLLGAVLVVVALVLVAQGADDESGSNGSSSPANSGGSSSPAREEEPAAPARHHGRARGGEAAESGAGGEAAEAAALA